MSHRLDPLLNPSSIAVIGASKREGSVGWRTMHNLLTGGYEGRLYAINPGYESVLGVPCFPSLSALPETVEHVILTLGDKHIEAALDDVIAHGARAATMMSTLVLENDVKPYLRDRVQKKVRESGLVVCGANGMGFYNFRRGVWVCGFDTRENHVRNGNVTLISHSGGGMAGIVDCEDRIDFNIVVSTGQELDATMDQYMDYALDQPETRVIGLFMETARNPAGMIAAFEKALQRSIPVVVLKVGRTEMSARLAVSHSGAIAGSDDTYNALFDRYGVQRVEDMNELANALIMFAQPCEPAEGGLVALHDSGGQRQLLIDLASDLDVPLTGLTPETAKTLESLIYPGLPPVNPLDAWGAGGPESDEQMGRCFETLVNDPGAAIGAVVHDRGPLNIVYPEYVEYLRRARRVCDKPVFFVSNHTGNGSDPLIVEATREGLPVMDGMRPFLAGVKCLLGYRDFRNRPAESVPECDDELVARWRTRLTDRAALDEYESGQLLGDFGVPVNPSMLATDPDEVLLAAEKLGYPIVLKTAEAGILHKTDQDGIRLNITTEEQLLEIYSEMAGRLGPRVLLSPMIDVSGQEMVLGMVRDEQFGPVVMLGLGGINVESIRDVACALPPFGMETARRLLDSLRLRQLLGPLRNRGAVDVEAFCQAASRFSVMAASLGDVLDEVDINPVIAHVDGVVALDALVVPRSKSG